MRDLSRPTLVWATVVVLAAAPAAWPGADDAPPPADRSAAPADGPDAAAARPPGAPLILTPNRQDVSPPLREIPPRPPNKQLIIRPTHDTPDVAKGKPDGWNGKVGIRHSPHVEQTSMPKRTLRVDPIVNVEGLGRGTAGFFVSGAPPDTTGAVGGGYFMQWVNVHYALYSTADGSMVNLPGVDWRTGSSIFSGMGGPCANTNDGDPIVLYDHLAGRWVMSQFALPNYPSPPFYQCIAVSTTGDPLGTWNRFEYTWPGNKFNDYPKLSVWPDGYYMSANEFSSAGFGLGAAVAVFERDQLLAGGTPQAVYWDLSDSYWNLLPVDLDGDTLPPAGSPGYFVQSDPYGLNDTIEIWEVDVDWSDPASSTCGTGGNDPSSTIPVTAYARGFDPPQPGTGYSLDAIGDRLMFPATYRNFGTHESIVLNHSCCGQPSGIRWYEIRDPGGTPPILYQEGTFTPDGDARWMGSIAQDAAGNMLLGYSVSGSSTSPSIRVAGRLADDPLGQMTIGEIEVATGSGYQTPPPGDSRNRWGDYSTMVVDPDDGCTFWYTQEYLTQTGVSVWRTRIASFQLPGCPPVDPIFSDGFENGDTTGWSDATP